MVDGLRLMEWTLTGDLVNAVDLERAFGFERPKGVAVDAANRLVYVQRARPASGGERIALIGVFEIQRRPAAACPFYRDGWHQSCPLLACGPDQRCARNLAGSPKLGTGGWGGSLRDGFLLTADRSERPSLLPPAPTAGMRRLGPALRRRMRLPKQDDQNDLVNLNCQKIVPLLAREKIASSRDARKRRLLPLLLVLVFSFAGTSGADTVMQKAYIKASNSEDGDRFGTSVTLEGLTLVVGAPDESSSSVGVGGEQGNGAHQSGAVYLFRRDEDGVWRQDAVLEGIKYPAGRLLRLEGCARRRHDGCHCSW